MELPGIAYLYTLATLAVTLWDLTNRGVVVFAIRSCLRLRFSFGKPLNNPRD